MVRTITDDDKRAFAEALLREPGNPFKAALSVINDVGLALKLAQAKNDPIVIEAKGTLVEEQGAKAFLPSKEEQARDVYMLAQSDAVDDEVRLKAHRLYAEIMSFIEKPQNQPSVVVQQGVMIVPVHGDDDQWEQRTIDHQRKLTNAAALLN